MNNIDVNLYNIDLNNVGEFIIRKLKLHKVFSLAAIFYQKKILNIINSSFSES